MSIEQVLRKIVEKAKWEHARVVWNGGSVRPSNSTDSIVHALLNSEEIEIKLKEKPVVKIRDMGKEE